MKEAYLAIDFGGGSGGVIAGCLSEGELVLDTIYRFPNRQVRMGGHVYWDFLSLFEDMKTGIRMAVEKGYTLKSIGIDTWGVDFGLIDKQGNLLGNPVCYRDGRTEGMPEEFFSKVDVKAHYAESGTQVMAINTLFQLYAMKKEDNAQLKAADKLLFMPDLFSYYLTGVANNEYSIASTSELLDAKARTWNFKLIRELGLPEHLFGEVVMPGTSRGFLKPEIKEQIGIDYEVEVIAVASHDTASAASVVPLSAEGEKVAFLSSGTWSLLGVMSDEPILTEEARLAGFTNEGGYQNRYRYLKNIMGLWMIQSVRREMAPQQSFDEICRRASKEKILSLVDCNDERFLSPQSMTAAVQEFCRETGQQEPVTISELACVIYNSLARCYGETKEQMESLLNRKFPRIYIIGGGSNAEYLNELTARYAGCQVSAGPTEATALGNLLCQMLKDFQN